MYDVVARTFASHQCDLGSNPGVNAIMGWVFCWFSPLLWVVFFWVLCISPLLKNQHFLIPIHVWMASTKTKNHLKLWMFYTVPQNHYLYYLFIYLFIYISVWRINFIKLSSVLQTSQLCKTYTLSSFLFCSWSEGRGPHCRTDNGLWMIKRKIAELKHSKRITVFNSYSSSPNGLWVNSPWGREE